MSMIRQVMQVHLYLSAIITAGRRHSRLKPVLAVRGLQATASRIFQRGVSVDVATYRELSDAIQLIFTRKTSILSRQRPISIQISGGDRKYRVVPCRKCRLTATMERGRLYVQPKALKMGVMSCRHRRRISDARRVNEAARSASQPSLVSIIQHYTACARNVAAAESQFARVCSTYTLCIRFNLVPSILSV